MAKKALPFFIVTVFAVVTLHAPTASSCSCIKSGSGLGALDFYDSAFLGEVIAIEDLHVPTEGGGYHLSRAVLFRVMESWKGKSAPVILVYTGNGAGDCGYSFEKGKTYLVFAERLLKTERKKLHEDKQALYTGICTHTEPESKAEAVIRELRAHRSSVTHVWPSW